jgi:phage recombination protein Bet
MAVNEQNSEVATINQQPILSFNEKELETIRNTVAKNSTNDEFRMFMHLARTYQLDPFNKEIWFIKYAKKGQDPKSVEPSIMTSRDGYLKIADRHPQFDGLISDVVRKNDAFKRTMDGVEHEYSSDRGPISGAYALVYRKDRKYPIYVFAPYEEYKADTKTWNNYPSAMILKVAESMALKRAFTVSGLVSREEMDVQQDEPIDVTSSSQDIDDASVSEKNDLGECIMPFGKNKGKKLKDLPQDYVKWVAQTMEPDNKLGEDIQKKAQDYLNQNQGTSEKNNDKNKNKETVQANQSVRETRKSEIKEITHGDKNLEQQVISYLKFQSEDKKKKVELDDLTDDEYNSLVKLLNDMQPEAEEVPETDEMYDDIDVPF